MASPASHRSLARSVERQSGACRALAQAMRTEAGTRGIWGRHDRRLIEGWAAQLDEIAHLLSAALADGEQSQLGYIARAGRVLALPFAFGAGFVGGLGQGVGASLYEDRFLDSPTIMECAAEVVAAESDLQIGLGAGEAAADDDDDGPPAEVQPGETPEFGPVLRRFRQSIHQDQHEFARHLETTQQSVSSWETGRSIPHTATLRHLRNVAAGADTPAGWTLVSSIDGLLRSTPEQPSSGGIGTSAIGTRPIGR